MRRSRGERKQARDIERMARYASEPGACRAGRSLREQIEDELDKWMGEYRGQKRDGLDGKTARGVVRGLAIALAILTQPYENRAVAVKVIETGSMKRVKEGESDG